MRRLLMLLSLAAFLTELAEAQDSAPHSTRFIAVADSVRLEVLDFGGSGQPLVLLAGLGGTAHSFDAFAPKLAVDAHVYAITRRGFGRSSAPAFGYDADELGDDVLAVIDSLGLIRPILAGHSMAGEELSSIGSRHPEKVSGLVYLDAGADYAVYDESHGHVTIDINEIIRQLDKLRAGSGASLSEKRRAMLALADSRLPAFLRGVSDELALPAPPAEAKGQPRMDRVTYAISSGQRKYTSIRGPVLAIFASPLEAPPAAPPEMVAEVNESVERQVRAFERAVPQARVVRLPYASHFVMRSHEGEVLREMRAFITRLKSTSCRLRRPAIVNPHPRHPLFKGQS